VRTLVVAEQYPWPARDGYRQRLHHLVAGLARAGEVEVLALHRPGTAAPDDPPIEGVEARAFPVGGDPGIREWGPRWVRGDMPRRVLAPDWTQLGEHLAQRCASGGIDLVWYSHVDTWWGTHAFVTGVPAILDFDNLEHLALRLRRRIPPRFPPGSGPGRRAAVVGRWALSRAFDLVDERRFDRLQRRAAGEVERVVVCSELDRERSGCPNAVVVPNGCDAPADPVSDRTPLRGEVPTFLFVGALDYEPNTEAVEWFVREVLPLLRAEVPDARVRIVGRGADRVAWVAGVPGVDLVGPVEVLDDELRAADVSIVPIRVGAGTRLKVVEALANRLPLVTTTVGCEGIDLRNGHDALIEDDAAGFAAACARLAVDGALRQRLADAGAELFERRYDWQLIEGEVADLAREVVTAVDRA